VINLKTAQGARPRHARDRARPRRRGDRVTKAASQAGANQTTKVLPGKAEAVITLFFDRFLISL
jgi:hypothetical protein